jgi:hypothetical protein
MVRDVLHVARVQVASTLSLESTMDSGLLTQGATFVAFYLQLPVLAAQPRELLPLGFGDVRRSSRQQL